MLDFLLLIILAPEFSHFSLFNHFYFSIFLSSSYTCEPNTSDLDESNHPYETNEMDDDINDTDDEYLTTSVTYEGPNSEQLLTESSTHKLDENTNQNSNKIMLNTAQSNDEEFDDYEYQENLSNTSQIDSSSRREELANEHTM